MKVKYILRNFDLSSLGLLWVIIAQLGYITGSVYAFLQVLDEPMWYIVAPLLICVYLPLILWFYI